MTNIASPGEGWKLVARRRLVADKIYHAGCAIPAASLGSQQLHAMLHTGLVVWLPPNTPIAVQPTELPEPPKPEKKPKVTLVESADGDPVHAWKATLEHMVRRCGGDRQRARDLLDADPRARALYLLACRVGCAEEASRRRVVSVGPDEIGL